MGCGVLAERCWWWWWEELLMLKDDGRRDCRIELMVIAVQSLCISLSTATTSLQGSIINYSAKIC